jgi:hypothetical protein
MTTQQLEQLTGLKIRKTTDFVLTPIALYGRESDGTWREYDDYEEAVRKCSESSTETTSG